jgi:hypothetical protein
MRYVLVVLWMLLGSVTPATAQVSIGIGLPGVSIGINLPVYPELVPVPGYPVYYAPQVDANFFFYDGMYWVYQRDNWYASSWYNGPWGFVGPEVVPLFVLRIPVGYYRSPPAYFRGWRSDAPPRWGQHWGNGWEQRRSGWDRWDRRSAPAPAPLPVYQRQYSGDRYPRGAQQQALHNQNYRYQPHDAVVRQHYQQKTVEKGPPPSQRGQQGRPQEPRPKEIQQSGSPPQRGSEDVKRSAQTPAPPQQRGAAGQDQNRQPQPVQREQPRPSQENTPQGGSQERKQGQDSNRDRSERDRGERDRGERDRGERQDRNR